MWVALRKLRKLIEARAGLRPPMWRCLACDKPPSQCMCLAGPTLEEPIGDESERPTRPENVRAKVIVPSSVPPPKEPHR